MSKGGKKKSSKGILKYSIHLEKFKKLPVLKTDLKKRKHRFTFSLSSPKKTAAEEIRRTHTRTHTKTGGDCITWYDLIRLLIYRGAT